jgi:hypothetical protein
MSALPCPVADPFVAADQAYATITGFLRSEEAWQVKHSELERQLEGMGRDLMRTLLQAHLELRQPGQAVEPVRDAAGTPRRRNSARTWWTAQRLCVREQPLGQIHPTVHSEVAQRRRPTGGHRQERHPAPPASERRDHSAGRRHALGPGPEVPPHKRIATTQIMGQIMGENYVRLGGKRLPPLPKFRPSLG